MSSMTVTVFVHIIGRYGLAPDRTALKLFMINVDTSVDNIYVDAFTTIPVVEILGKSAKGKPRPVAYASKTLFKEQW